MMRAIALSHPHPFPGFDVSWERTTQETLREHLNAIIKKPGFDKKSGLGLWATSVRVIRWRMQVPWTS